MRFLLDGLSPGRLSPHTLSFTSLGRRRQLLLIPREHLDLPHDFLRVLEARRLGSHQNEPGPQRVGGIFLPLSSNNAAPLGMYQRARLTSNNLRAHNCPQSGPKHT